MIERGYRAISKTTSERAEFEFALTNPVSAVESAGDYYCAVSVSGQSPVNAKVFGVGPFQAMHLGLERLETEFQFLRRDWVFTDQGGAEVFSLIRPELAVPTGTAPDSSP